MKSLNEIEDFLDDNTIHWGKAFHAEINTEENKDYRRGFLAGVYFAFLRMQAEIGGSDDAAIE